MQIIMADEKFEKDVLEDNNLKDHKTLNFYLIKATKLKPLEPYLQLLVREQQNEHLVQNLQ